ncbi:Zinc finger HIT domain-containing protein 2 [Halotydeus destructor]|nr:Zinc finger HIT domain-containing protein 2 [Halotydeus destructor]
MESKTRSTCEFCNEKQSKYTCPKCGFDYCDMECYKSEKHGICSQSFYREWVFNSLKDLKVDEDTKLKTLQLIKKSREMEAEEVAAMEDEEDSDEDEHNDFEARFAGIDLTADELDDATVSMIMERLTDEEKKQFENLVDSGEIMNLLPSHEFWKPWWSDYAPKLVEEVDQPNVTETTSLVPLIAQDIPSITVLSSKAPSENLRHSIVNVIISYCYVCRYFNGEHHLNALEAISELQSSSSVISGKVLEYTDSQTAAQSLIQCVINEKKAPIPFVGILLEDAKKVLTVKDIALRLLSDILSTIKIAITKSKTTDKSHRKQLKLLSKKIEYYLSWTFSFGDQLTLSLA